MTDAWQVAELLEDIARNADPYSIIRNSLAKLLGNSRQPMRVIYMSEPDPNGKAWTFTYYAPVAATMEGVKGTPDEVVAWLKTGLQAEQDITIFHGFPGGPHFALKCIYRDQTLVSDLHDVQTRFLAVLKERGIPTE